MRLLLVLCGVVFAVFVPPLIAAQHINYNSFNTPQASTSSPFSTSCPAGINILFCVNYTGYGPSFVQDFYPPLIDPNAGTDGGLGSTNYALQLTQNASSQDSSVWFATPQDVVDGFTTWYAVKINYQGGGDGNTADGLAFVIQNASGGKTDTIANCPETGVGPSVLGNGGGCLGYGGIDNSIALEMDTFYSSWDPQQSSRNTSYSDNHLALQGCGLDGNGSPIANSPTHTTTPNCLISLGGTTTLITNPIVSSVPSAAATAVLLSDGNPHQIVMVYNGPNDSPANYLTVYLDATYNPGTHTPVTGTLPLFSGPFDITKYMKLSNAGGSYNPAYVGFTAATGGDYEQHEVMGWTFSPHANQPNFGNVNVCPAGQTTPAPCSETFTYTYQLPNGATLVTPKVVTQGVTGLDFNLNTASSTCSGAIAPGGSCTLSVTFAPLAPGTRMGAIQLFDTSGTLQASTLIYGVGQGPAAAVAPGAQSLVNTGSFALHLPRGVVVDAAGDIFIADNNNSRVIEVAANGTVSTVGADLRFPNSLALDGAGNLYVSITRYVQDISINPNVVVKVPFGCTSAACQSTVGSGLGAVVEVSVDAAGNVFLNDVDHDDIVKVPAGCITSACQTVVYGPIAGSVPGSPAVDAVGNLFIPDSGLRAVVEVPVGCTTASCQIQIGQGLLSPLSAAVDAAGDVFVTDDALGQVVEIPVRCASTACQSTVVSGISPYSLALDGQGDIFVSDQNSSQVVEFNRSQPQTLNFPGTTVGSTSIASVLLQNIGNQTLQAETPGLLFLNGAYFFNTPGSGTFPDCYFSATLVAGAECNTSIQFAPQSYTQPSTGFVTFSDNALNSVNALQTVSLFGIGAKPVQTFFPVTVTAIGSGSGAVTDVSGAISCVEANGTLSGTCAASLPGSGLVTFIATASGGSTFEGWGGICASSGTNPTCSVVLTQAANITATFVNPNYGNINVCPVGQAAPAPCSSTVPVTFNLATTTTMGVVKVVTQGATGLDFTLGSGNTCVGIINAGNSCNVNVNFTPLAAGLRAGAVELFDSNGNPVATSLIYGVGEEPVLAFGSGAQTTVGIGLSNPVGVAVDAAGDVFIGDYGNQRVVEVPAGGGNQITIASGLNYPEGVAVDGAGNVYIADSDNNRVLKVPPGGGPGTTVGSGLNTPTGVAVDRAGNVLIADYRNNRVVEVPAGGGPQTTIGSGLNVPQAVAVDGSGNVFIADSGNNQVVKVTSSGVQTTLPASGLNDPISLAVDAAGDVFIGNYYNSNVVEVTPGGVQTLVPATGLGGGVLGVAVDAAGDIFLSDFTDSRLLEVNRSQVPSFTFATTNVGSTSIDSPKSVALQNVGNQPLAGSLALNFGGNFTQNAAADCSTQLPLAPGAFCSDSFSFAPQSETFLSGSAVFADNNFNLSSATQTITLSGTGAVNGVAGTVAVPNVVGQVQSAANAPIAGAGLAMGTVSTASSSTAPSGSIISQSPVAGTQVAVGSAVNLLVSSGIAKPPAANPLLLENNYFVTGDYVSAGVSLLGTGHNGIATGTITVPSYDQSTINGVPDGADVVDAFLYWETLELSPVASSTGGNFNGYPVVGQQIGSDIPNFTDGAFTGIMRSYRANVNAYLPVGAKGVRIVSGTYSVALPDGGQSGLPYTEGASLVMVYRVLSPNFPLKSVVIYDGAAALTAGGTQVVQGFYDAVGGASGTGKSTNLFGFNGSWHSDATSVSLGQSNQFSAPLSPGYPYAAVLLSTPVNNSDNDGILDAWKVGPPTGDFHAGQPGYYDVKTGTWVGLPGAKHGQKDLFVQLDYMCGAVLAGGSCDPTKENLFPSPDADGNDPLAMVQQSFANSGVQLHLQVGNAVPEDTCIDGGSSQLCQFPNQPGVIGWKNSLEFSKLYPRNLQGCLGGGDCTTRFPYGQKDSYHYVLMGHSLAIPAWNTRYGTLRSIVVANGVTTIGTVDRGTGIKACPSRITLEGVIGDPSLNGVYNTTGCADTKTITFATPGVPSYTYPNSTLPEPVIGLTSGTITSISGYSDLGGADSAVTLGLWLTAPGQDMSKKANVLAGTIFHEIGHTLGLSHGGLYYDTPNSYIPTFEGNCKPNYQSVMNYLFQLDLVGPSQTLAFSNQTLNTLNENSAGSVLQLTDALNNPATFPTSAWYVPYTTGSPASPATRHCDGTPLIGDSAYRVDASIAPVTPAWSSPQDLSFTGVLQPSERGFNDLTNMDLRQLGATGGEFASLASVFTFGSSVSPLNINAGGTVALGSGGTVALGSGGTVALGSGGNVTLSSAGSITLASAGTVALGSGGNVTLGSSGGIVTPGSSGTVALGSGGTVTLSTGGTIALGSGGTVALGSGGTVALGSGGTIALGSGGTVIIPSTGGTYTIDGNGGTIALGSGGTVALGSGGTVTLSGAGTIALGSGGTIALGSGGTVALGSGGTIALGSGGTIALGSGGNLTLSGGGTIALGSGGTIALGSGGNVALGSGGTVTLGGAGTVALGSGGTVALGSGGTATLGAGGTVTLPAGGTVALGSGGLVALGSGGTIALGSGGTVALGSSGTVTLAFGGTIALGSGGAPIVIGPNGSYTFGSSGGTVALGSGGTVALGSGGNVTLSAGGTIALGSGGTIALGSGGTVALGSGGVVTLGNGGSLSLGSGEGIGLASVGNITPASAGPQAANELTYETANSVVRPPSLPTQTFIPSGVRINWKAPTFGVVQTYTIYRSSNGATPLLIGSVSGINGNPPATEFTDTNPDLTSQTVVYTITTTLVPDTTGPSRQSVFSPPAVLKNDQSIALGALPSSVLITSTPIITATAMSGAAPNGLQVVFSATGSCAIGNQSIAGNISSATVILNATGNCTVIASQPGSTTFNAANSVSGAFFVLPLGSTTKSQTINFAQLPNAQYGGSFTLSATSTSGATVSFSAAGPCTTSGQITGVGVCSITASTAASDGFSAALLTRSFNIYPAVLKVTANSASITYGQPLPSLTYAYSGFVSGDTAAVVIGAPALTTTGTAASNAGSYPITVSTGTLATTNYSFLYVSGILTVQQASQTALVLTTSSPLIYGQSETINVSGGSTGSAITYNLIGGPCNLAGALLTASSGTGACQVTATMAGNSNYKAVTSAPVNVVSLSVASQTITFTINPPATAAYNSTFTVAATGGASGNTVTFTSSGACSNAGATYTMTNSTGSCSVIANQAGNTNYAAAAQFTRTVVANGPLVSLSTSSINFGTVYQGSISAQTITVSNVGTAPVTITDPILSIVKGGNSNEFVSINLCPRPLAAGKNCTMLVGFIAGPYYTPQTATLQVMSNAPGSPQPVALSATVIHPQASLNPTSVSFGTIKHADSGTITVTLSNSGGTPLALTGINVRGANASNFVQTNTCGNTLAVGASCIVAVKFTPPAVGTFSATLTVVDNAQSGTQTVPLLGKGN